MNQTAFMFATVAFAFLFYVTVKGDLPKWLGLFGLAGGGSTPGSTVPASSSPASGTQAAGGLQALQPLAPLGQLPSVLQGGL